METLVPTAFAPPTPLSVNSLTNACLKNFTCRNPGQRLRFRPASSTHQVSARTTPQAVLGSRTSWNVETEKKYKVTVQSKRSETVVEVDGDTDLRQALLAKGIDVYTLGGKLRNCGGGGQCGTCLISIEEGAYYAGARTPREEFVLADKPDTWRLACRTKVNGDIAIRTKPQA